MENKHEIIKEVCDHIGTGKIRDACLLIQEKYPFDFHEKPKSKLTDQEAYEIFQRDHFIDQYSGDRLVFIPTLRLINLKLGDEFFPYHPHGKMSKCHIAFWEMIPSLDHVIPLARGGTDEKLNIVTTSMLRNSIKANWTLEELHWVRVETMNFPNWDGQVKWFIDYYDKNQKDFHLYQNFSYFKHWYVIATNSK
jgi:hypothetical protein